LLLVTLAVGLFDRLGCFLALVVVAEVMRGVATESGVGLVPV
jgi:hypothetical protein